MTCLTADLYRVKSRDISKAGAVLADAFRHDPIWTKIFEREASDDRKMGAWYEGSIRYCLKYGMAYATSEHLEGIACCVPGEYADMTVWRMLWSGAFISGMRMGVRMVTHAQKMATVFEPLEADRRASMKGRAYVYLMFIGVASQHQGQGLGGKLLRALFEESEQAGVPLYLETETERNARMYERLGFRLINQISLPVLSLPVWEMVREPGA
jgi:ribosomal protein S18 acetylase RimI-like enzyme